MARHALDVFAPVLPVTDAVMRRMPDLVEAPDIRPTVDGRYRHWDSLRHLDPPDGLTHEEWWVGIKFARSQIAQPLPLLDVEGATFTVSVPGVALQKLRQIDMDASGQITVSEHVTNPETRRTFLRSRCSATRSRRLICRSAWRHPGPGRHGAPRPGHRGTGNDAPPASARRWLTQIVRCTPSIW